MKKTTILFAGIIIALIASAIYLGTRPTPSGTGGATIDDALLQEAIASGYTGQGSGDDYYKLYTSNTSTRNNVYELISAIKATVEQANSADQAELTAALEGKTETEQEQIKTEWVFTDNNTAIFLQEYQKYK